MQRAMVDFGGIYFQLIFIPILYVFYLTTSSGVFLYAIFLNYVSALFNLNPIFRFDGYWIFSDITGIPNLRKRSLELLRYFFQRFIAKRKNITEPVFLRISGKIKSFLCVYGIVSTCFFILLFYNIIFLLPVLVIDYPGLVYKTFIEVISSVAVGDWRNIVNTLSGFFFFSLIILMLSFATYRLGKRIKKRVMRHGRASRIH